MKIGFFNEHGKNNIGKNDSKTKYIIGDEVLAITIINGLKAIDKNIEGEVYAPEHLPDKKLDIMIYMSGTKPNAKWADTHILYLQTGLPKDFIRKINSYKYDGYISYSQNLIEQYEDIWENTLYLPFCIDTKDYYPAQHDPNFEYEITYVGGALKEKNRIEKYLYPATKFNLGLFGSWKQQRAYRTRKFNFNYLTQQLKLGNSIPAILEYKKLWPESKLDELTRLCKGKIAQEDIAKLYSSSKIMLNFGTAEIVKDNTITLRTYEVLACKGFLISDRTPIAEELLEDCVVFTDGGKDLERKIRYYLAHPEERRRIAENGYNWVMKNATKEIVIKKLYDFLKRYNCVERRV